MYIGSRVVRGCISLSLVVSSLIASNSLVTAQLLQSEPTVPTAETTVENFQTHTLVDTFSIRIPQNWIFADDYSDRSATITNYNLDRLASSAPHPNDVKTEVTWITEFPDTFVERELEALIAQNYPIRRYTTVEVDGQTALRLWVSDLPTGYSEQLITFIGYEDVGTAKIVTSHNAYSLERDVLIEQIHDSFELAF